VWTVLDAKDQYPSQWAAIESIAGTIVCHQQKRQSIETEVFPTP
jgi:hypothetical protein